MNPVCWLNRRRLGAYRDGELTATGRTRAEAHLGRCPACAAEATALTRLQTALRAAVPEPPEAVWDAFWPQVRARVAATPAPEHRWWWASEGFLGPRRLMFGSALAAAALAVLAILAPWQQIEQHPRSLSPAAPGVVASTSGPIAPIQQVVVQSVETADPQSSVMVYASPESDMTVVWVFGLERTDI